MKTALPVMATPQDVHAIVEAAFARQVRMLGFFALLLAVVGFFAGHYVAAGQAHTMQAGLTVQITRLSATVARLSQECRTIAEQQSTVDAELARLAQMQAMLAERETVAAQRLIRSTQMRRAQTLDDLQPYLESRRFIAPDVVADVVNRFSDEQISHAQTLLPETRTAFNDAAATATAPALSAPDLGNDSTEESGGFEFVLGPSDEGMSDPAVVTPAIPVRSTALAETLARPAPRRLHFFNGKQDAPAPPQEFRDAGLIPLPPR